MDYTLRREHRSAEYKTHFHILLALTHVGSPKNSERIMTILENSPVDVIDPEKSIDILNSTYTSIFETKVAASWIIAILL